MLHAQMGANIGTEPTDDMKASLQPCWQRGLSRNAHLLFPLPQCCRQRAQANGVCCVRLHSCRIICRVTSTTLELWRFDVSARLQSCGQWDQALETAQKHDRINLKATHFAYAQYLESMGDCEAAIRHYEQADTHR